MIRFKYKPITLVLLVASIIMACNKNEDQIEAVAELGTPLILDFTMPEESNNITRSHLDNNKTVFVTPDEGQKTWYAYRYESSTGLWKAQKVYTYNNDTEKWVASTSKNGITWTASTMLLYAIVRNDDHPTPDEEAAGESPLSQPISISAEQNVKANLDASDLYGSGNRFTYSTGRVSMHLQHIVGQMRVIVKNCPNPASWTCVTDQEGVSLGPYGPVARYYTQGKIRLADGEIDFMEPETSINLKLYREYASGTEARFVVYMLPLGEPQNAAFTLTNGTTTYTYRIGTYGGVTLEGGCTTLVNITLP